jgi:aspartokinase/homoserine dehydrogenase 1
VDVQAPCSIIAAVGDGMHFTTGVSGRFFSAFGDAKINILAISQGSSERNISAVVLESESTRALRAVHAAFRLSQSVVRVGIVGMNEIGESLLQLLESERNKLKSTFDIDLQVCALVCEASSKDIIVVKDSQNKVDSITWSTYNLLTGGSMLLGAPASSALNGDASGVDAVKCLPGGVSSILDRVFSEDNPHSVM